LAIDPRGDDQAHATLVSSKLEFMEGQSHTAMITAPHLFAPLVISFVGEADIPWSSE
jgi:hypothetical protein